MAWEWREGWCHVPLSFHLNPGRYIVAPAESSARSIKRFLMIHKEIWKDLKHSIDIRTKNPRWVMRVRSQRQIHSTALCPAT